MNKEKHKKYPNITSTVSATETTGALQYMSEDEFENGELRELVGLETPNVRHNKEK